jgi:hypothetical protein
MKLTKKQALQLDEMLHQAYATVACGIDPIENKEIIAQLAKDIRAVKEFLTGGK